MSPETPSNRRSLSWPAAFALVALLGLAAGVWVFERLREAPADAVRQTREVLGDLRSVAEAFNSGTVVTSFVSYATEVSGSSYFQFATLRQIEVFERKDSRATMWGQLRLPDVVVQARAPVTYTYYLDLDGSWEMRLEDGAIHVLAPEIGHNPPALDASELSWEVRAGSVFRDEGEVDREGGVEVDRVERKEQRRRGHEGRRRPVRPGAGTGTAGRREDRTRREAMQGGHGAARHPVVVTEDAEQQPNQEE